MPNGRKVKKPGSANWAVLNKHDAMMHQIVQKFKIVVMLGPLLPPPLREALLREKR